MRFRNRIRNAWAALRGHSEMTLIGSVGIELDVDTGPLERGLERAKAKAAELAAVVRTTIPPIMVQSRNGRIPKARIDQINAEVNRFLREGKCLVFDADIIVYHFVDGRWTPLNVEQNGC